MGWGLIDQDIKSLARHGRASRAGRALRQTAAAPGQPDTFELLEHNAYGAGADRRFAAIAITHEMANNLGTQAAQILRATDVEQGSYRNRFSAAPAALRLLPWAPAFALSEAPGPLHALVMTQGEDPIHADRDGRVRIQFAWQRGDNPLAGGLNGPTTPAGAATGHAPGDATSGTWVRVAQGVGGPDWGALFTPRPGSEVLVDFIDGDIDRPLIVGQLHNGPHELPWPAGVDAGTNHPGTISGWHHPHLDGQGANQWVVDDATGQLRMRLASHSSATGHSELTLGHLIQQSARGGSGAAQRGQWLGEGFYGHTEGWAMVRAGEGLLLSTSARQARGASVARTQMDASEAVGQARLRGWSEVMFSSYGDLLQTLEFRLNQMCMDGRPRSSWTSGKREAVGVDPKRWGASGGEALSADELETVSDAWYPVHAVGYNWLRSNGEAAKDVAQRIREIIAYYKRLKFDCSKVIVVTHSMGGLVGRALIHPDYGNAQDVVAGIVHGAMPAVGAAAAYKRIRMGFEGSGIMGYIAKKVLGDTGPKVTAVLANSAGGLQLLPSERYGSDWLKASVDGKEVMSLPKSDPYNEIYTVQDKWYRLINPEWINPALAKGSSVNETNIRLLQAQEFHQDIGSAYHPETYLSYGIDDKQKAWGEVTWQTMRVSILGGGLGQMLGLEKLSIELPAANWLVVDDDGDGAVVLNDGLSQNDPGQRFRAEIDEPAQIGDGTVPAERSAQDPVRQGKARVAFQQAGYEHQNSYKDDAVLSSTLHAICKIALTSFTWKSCP